MSRVPNSEKVTMVSHGVEIRRSRSKADTQALLIRGLGLGPVEAAEKSEKFGPQAVEAAITQQD